MRWARGKSRDNSGVGEQWKDPRGEGNDQDQQGVTEMMTPEAWGGAHSGNVQCEIL